MSQTTTSVLPKGTAEIEFQRLIDRALAFLKPEPVLLVSEWADQHRILPSKGASEPGPWRTARTPYLKAIMDALSTGSPYHTVVFAKGAQIGAPLALDTPIPTPSGWTLMGDIQPGDKVFGLNGKPSNVLGVSPIFEDRQCYRVTFSDGESIVTDTDHKWTVDVEKSSAEDNGRVTLTTGEMYGTDKKSRRRLHFKRGNRNRFAIPLTDHLDMPDADLVINPYTLGAWLGDGNSASNQITTHKDDADEMASYIVAEGYVAQVRNLGPAAGNGRNILVGPKEIFADRTHCIRGHDLAQVGQNTTVKHGKPTKVCAECHRQRARKHNSGIECDPVLERTTLYSKLVGLNLVRNKHIPIIYLRASLQQRLDLLAGLMDTDGHITKNGRCELTFASEQLANDSMELIRSVGYKPTVSERVCKATYIKGRKVNRREIHYRISFMAYRERPVVKLKRKLNSMVDKDGRRTSETFRRRIVDISPVDSVPTRCISVDTHDHLFLAGRGMIATHNTEAGNNWLGYCIHHAPAPMMMVQPTIDMVKRISKQRIQPMIDATPVLRERIAPSRSRDSGNTVQQKDFAGGTLVLSGGNSASGLRSMPARYLFLDEVDALPGDVEGEGDPIELAIARTSTFKRNRKIFMCSTPTIEGQSRIWQSFMETDQQYYHVPCPDCQEFQIIDWSRIIWDEGKPETASMVCQHCGVLIPERHKAQMLAAGVWKATAEGMDSGVIGFHLSSLYSPPGWYSWADAAKDFIKAKGHPTKLQSFVNTKLGQCWEDRTGERVEHDALMARREMWAAVPVDTVVLTAGVDVQDDRLEISILGWTASEQVRVISHSQLWGNPGEDKIWGELDEILLTPHYTEDNRIIRIRATCIDSGGHHTQRAYEFCRSRIGRKVVPIKGRSGNHPIWPTKSSKTTLSKGVSLFLIGVDTAKDVIRSAFAVNNPELPRYVAFHADLADDYFKQLTAEKRVTSYSRSGQTVRNWKKAPGTRNEALDCFVYNIAALEYLKHSGLRLKAVARQVLQDYAPGVLKPETPSSKITQPPPTAKPPRCRVSSALL